jgi:transketolase
LKSVMKDRFINAGVAEQNMISVAAAMAREGLDAWVYSIAPFCYARPFEQIRNDVAFHRLPVKIIGNGGGYGYGVMGPTHHAIEDYGVMLTLPNMHVYIPAFDEDVTSVIDKAANQSTPAYLRLGRGEIPEGFDVPKYESWRQLISGDGMVVIVAGPIVGTYIQAFQSLPKSIRPNLWVITEMPVDKNPPPTKLVEQMSAASGICIVEEHVRQGGLASQIALFILVNKLRIGDFHHLYASAHHFDTYGSQNFLRNQSGIDIKSLMSIVAPQ